MRLLSCLKLNNITNLAQRQKVRETVRKDYLRTMHGENNRRFQKMTSYHFPINLRANFDAYISIKSMI